VEWRGAALVVPEQQLDDLPVDGGVVHHQHPHRRLTSPHPSRSPSVHRTARNGPLLLLRGEKQRRRRSSPEA
jgi:hypothetical protein